MFRPEGGECWNDVQRRAEAFLAWLVERELGGAVQKFDCSKSWGKSLKGHKIRALGFTHGGFIKEVCNILLGSHDRANDAKNTSLWRFQIARRAGKSGAGFKAAADGCLN